MKRILLLCSAAGILLASSVRGTAGDWTGFRGADGSGVSDDKGTPVTWSDTQNLKWKVELPGPGSSSPIVVGNRVLVTCFSGFDQNGGVAGMKRHLMCFDRSTGRLLWNATVASVPQEDPYTGMMRTHGFASQTPVSDGERVYVFFGKSGVLAFDLEGKQLWQTSVGLESSRMRWGSGASPILYGDTVIVNASDESEALRALDKKTGKEVWKAEASSLDSVYSTPLILKRPDGESDLIALAQGEVWGLNPANGKLRWYAVTNFNGTVSPSAVAADGIVYMMAGRGSGALAVKAGGKNDVTDTHIAWTSRTGSNIPSPLVHEGHLYWVDDNGIVRCANAKTGELVYQKRLEGLADGGERSEGGAEGDRGRGGPGGGSGGGFGGGRGGGGGFYASVAYADGKLYAVSRNSGTFVIAGGTAYEQLAQNRFESDRSIFNASPAISDGAIFLRSDKALYCVANQ